MIKGRIWLEVSVEAPGLVVQFPCRLAPPPLRTLRTTTAVVKNSRNQNARGRARIRGRESTPNLQLHSLTRAIAARRSALNNCTTAQTRPESCTRCDDLSTGLPESFPNLTRIVPSACPIEDRATLF